MYVIRDKLKYRAKVRTKSQLGNTGFADGLLFISIFANEMVVLQCRRVTLENNFRLVGTDNYYHKEDVHNNTSSRLVIKTLSGTTGI